MLLDEDSQAKYLVNLLQSAGHDVITVKSVDLMNHPEALVLDFARQSKRVLRTRDCDDFQELHQINPLHSGIFAVYQGSDLSKNMSYQHILKAIVNLEAAEYMVQNQFIILNQWNY
jgi:predicted nuclease of predicted toxin-antitoxin system